MDEQNSLNYFVGSLPPQFPGQLEKGQRGYEVKELQEFLSLSGYNLALDGIFGTATENALYLYSREQLGLKFRSKILTKRLWKSLTGGMRLALRRQKPKPFVGDTIVSYAKAHLKAGAAELPQNSGPWVRLYMKGNEGPEWAWCAGMLSFIYGQGLETHGIPRSAAPDSFSVDKLAFWGSERGKLITLVTESMPIQPGAIFLIYKGNQDWIHTGIVVSKFENTVETIEGNTNVAGSREGIAVMRRFRTLNNLHIIQGFLPEYLPDFGNHRNENYV